jgi:hypothetical protein
MMFSSKLVVVVFCLFKKKICLMREAFQNLHVSWFSLFLFQNDLVILVSNLSVEIFLQVVC